MANAPVVDRNFIGNTKDTPGAWANAASRSPYENSVCKVVLLLDRTGIKCRYDNPTSGNLTIKNAVLYWTVDNTRTGTIQGYALILFGGNGQTTIAANGSATSDDITGLPAAPRTLWWYTGYNSATGEYLGNRYISPANGEGFESASSAVGLTGRVASDPQNMTGVPAVGGLSRAYCGSIIYTTNALGNENAILWSGDSNLGGDADSIMHYGHGTHAGIELGVPSITYFLSGSSFRSGYMLSRAANLALFQFYEAMCKFWIYMADTNSYPAMTSDAQGIALWADSKAGMTDIGADNLQMYFAVCTTPMRTAVAPAGESARIAGNAAKRAEPANGFPRYLGILGDFDLMLADPTNPSAYRSDLGVAAARLTDGTHYPYLGMIFLIRSINAALLTGVTSRIRPLVFPVVAVGQETKGSSVLTYVDCEVLAPVPSEAVNPKIGAGGSITFTGGGVANIVGGYAILPPASPVRRYVLKCRLYLSRNIQVGETFTLANVNLTGFGLLGEDGRPAVIDSRSQQASDYANNCTYTRPAGGGVYTTNLDDNFDRADGSPGANYNATYAGSASTIVSNKLSMPNGNRTRFIQSTDTVRMRRTIRFIPANGIPQVFMNRQAGGQSYHVIITPVSTYYVGQLTTSQTTTVLRQSANFNMLNTTNMHELVIEEIAPVGAERARFAIRVTDLGNAAGTGTPVNTAFVNTWDDNPGVGDSEKPASQTAGANGVWNNRGVTITVEHVKMETVTADVTGPAWPPDSPDTAAGYINAGGAQGVVPMTDGSLPLLPASAAAVDGFSGDGVTVEGAIVIGDNHVLLTLADADRVTAGGSAVSIDYAGGSGGSNLRDSVNNYALAKSNLLLTNNSEWEGEDEPEPEPEPSDEDPAGVEGLTSLLRGSQSPVARLYGALTRLGG